MGKLLNVDTYAQYMSAQNELLEVIADATTTDEEIEEIVSNLENKVDKETGKGLSDNNYDNSAKAKVDAIPSNPKYTDTIYDDTEITENISTLSEDLANKAEYFEAMYGTTTFEEIVSAVDDGKIVFIKKDIGNNKWIKCPITQFYPNFAILFTFFDADNMYVYRLYKNTGWQIVTTPRIGATNTQIDARTEQQRYISPSNLKYAVDSVLCSDKASEALTTEQQNKAIARLGAEPKKGEWVLKGTLSGNADDRGNIDSGVNVDLSGCTELMIRGYGYFTGITSFGCNKGTLSYGLLNTTYKACHLVFNDGMFGIEPIVANIGNSLNNLSVRTNSYTTSYFVQYITNINITSSTTTSCNIEIYAR